MGLLTTLLTFPVSLPIQGALWTIRQVIRQAEDVHYDEESIQEQLMQLGLLFEMGEIDEEEFEQSETVLLDRLDEARARREETET